MVFRELGAQFLDTIDYARGAKMLRSCDFCGHQVSPNANACPKCGCPPTRPSEKSQTGGTFGCRKCGTELALYQYRGTQINDGGAYARIDGNRITIGREMYRTWTHRPCPGCGEPKPLLAYSETIFGKMHGGFLQLVVFVAVLTCFYYIPTLFRTVVGLVTRFDYQLVLNLPHFLAAMLIATAALILSFRYAEFGTAHARRWVFVVPLVMVAFIYRMMMSA